MNLSSFSSFCVVCVYRLMLRESRASNVDSGPSSLRIVIPRDAPSVSASARPVVVRAPPSAGSRYCRVSQ